MLEVVGTLSWREGGEECANFVLERIDGSVCGLYNTTTGTLSYDADGNGAGSAVAFVTLLGIPALTTADFTII